MQADCREAVEVCEHQGLAEDTGEEDGRHGPSGRTEVDELLRMRSERRRRGAPDLGMRSERRRRGAPDLAESRCASTRGWPRTQMERTAAMVPVAVRRSTSCSGCGVNGEGGVPCPGGSWASSNSWDPTAAEGLEVPCCRLVKSLSSSDERSACGSKETMAPLGRTRMSPLDKVRG